MTNFCWMFCQKSNDIDYQRYWIGKNQIWKIFRTENRKCRVARCPKRYRNKKCRHVVVTYFLLTKGYSHLWRDEPLVPSAHLLAKQWKSNLICTANSWAPKSTDTTRKRAFPSFRTWNSMTMRPIFLFPDRQILFSLSPPLHHSPAPFLKSLLRIMFLRGHVDGPSSDRPSAWPPLCYFEIKWSPVFVHLIKFGRGLWEYFSLSHRKLGAADEFSCETLLISFGNFENVWWRLRFAVVNYNVRSPYWIKKISRGQGIGWRTRCTSVSTAN